MCVETDNILMEFIKYFIIFGLSLFWSQLHACVLYFEFVFFPIIDRKQIVVSIRNHYYNNQALATSILKVPSAFTSNKQILNVILNFQYCVQRYLPERFFYTLNFVGIAVYSVQRKYANRPRIWNWTERLVESKIYFQMLVSNDSERHQIIII